MNESNIAQHFAEVTQAAEMTMEFALDEDEKESLVDFLHEHNRVCKYYDDGTHDLPPGGAIGGRMTYSFTPTTLGTVTKVKCSCGEERDLTDYDGW